MKYYHLFSFGRSKILYISRIICSQHSLLHTVVQNDYQVTIKGKEVISSVLKPTHQYWPSRSNLDLLLQRYENGAFFYYKKKDNAETSLNTVVKTLKTSLSEVLSTFSPIAGEIVSNTQGEPELKCSNGGVEFIHAQADVELKDLDIHHPQSSVSGKLVPKINHGVFSVQVTELKCGGIILGCGINHQVADNYSLNMFLVAWAKYAKSKTRTVIPAFRPSILNPRQPIRYDSSIDNLYVSLQSFPPPSSSINQLSNRIYYIPFASINSLQLEASLNSKETKISKVEALSAFLWKLLAHDQGNREFKKTSRIGIVVDGRRFLREYDEKALEAHFGNVLSLPFGVLNKSDLRKMPLNEVAKYVHKFLAKAKNKEHFRGIIDWVEQQRPNIPLYKIGFGLNESKGDVVLLSSGYGLPVMDMDFGWGNPEFGLPDLPLPPGDEIGYVYIMQNLRKKGDWIVNIYLKQKDLEIIESLAPLVFRPLTLAYLSV